MFVCSRIRWWWWLEMTEIWKNFWFSKRFGLNEFFMMGRNNDGEATLEEKNLPEFFFYLWKKNWLTSQSINQSINQCVTWIKESNRKLKLKQINRGFILLLEWLNAMQLDPRLCFLWFSTDISHFFDHSPRHKHRRNWRRNWQNETDQNENKLKTKKNN